MRRLEMKPHNTSGCLITFCGLDGCGKTSMIRMLTQELKDEEIPVFVTKQPTDTMRKSEIFRTFMDDPDHSAYEYRALSLMSAADRIQHANKVILPALREGRVVISDRYIYSCLANLRARGYGADEWIYEIAKDIPQPDLAFFLDVPVETAIQRVRKRAEEKDRYIDMELQRLLFAEYKNICDENKGIHLSSVGGVENTFEKVRTCWNRFIAENRSMKNIK